MQRGLRLFYALNSGASEFKKVTYSDIPDRYFVDVD